MVTWKIPLDYGMGGMIHMVILTGEMIKSGQTARDFTKKDWFWLINKEARPEVVIGDI